MSEEEDANVSVISALRWIPRNYMMTEPVQFSLAPEEIEELRKRRADGVEEDDGAAKTKEDDDDDDDDDEGEEGIDADEQTQLEMAMNAMYLEKEDVVNENDSDVGSDAEDNRLKFTDQVVVSATIEEDHALLEIHVYDTSLGSLYVHHDVTLPAYPLCLEFLGVDGVKLGWMNERVPSRSFVAVGTVEPTIEVWSLDVMDPLEPSCSLQGHDDAVMSLSWNTLHQQYLASGSADATVAIWDLAAAKVSGRFKSLHEDKIQVVQWNPAEASVFLTGSFDGECCVVDARQAASSPSTLAARFARKTKKTGDVAGVESACWDPYNPARFAVSYEDGIVALYDVRMGSSASAKRRPICAFEGCAGGKACASVTANRFVKDLWATCGNDKRVKLWDLADMENPVLVKSKKLTIGKLFSCEFAYPNLTSNEDEFDPFLVGVGGSKGSLGLWHADDVEADETGEVGGDEVNEEEEEDAGRKKKKQHGAKREPVSLSQVFAGRIFRQPKTWSVANGVEAA